MATKPCSRCKIVKPLEDFSPDKRALTGRQPACKQCHAAAEKAKRYSDIDAFRASARAYYHSNGDRLRARAGESRKRNAEKIKARAKDYYRRNRQKMIDWVAANRKANPERTREWARGWQALRNSRKAGGASGSETRAWMRAQAKVCYWCGVKCPSDFHIDHYVPLAKGGAHELSNLVIACPPCNRRKQAKDPFEFAREIGKLL